MNASTLALAAIGLWASVAALGVSLSQVPAFLLTGLSLLIGSLIAIPMAMRRTGTGVRLEVSLLLLPGRALAVGIYGLFGFHFLLFIALRSAPPVEANLVNYLWPLLIVVMAPLFLPGTRLRAIHLVAAGLGFAGAALAIAGGRELDTRFQWGYVAALGSAFIWSSYSLLTKRLSDVPTTALGTTAAASGLLSLACHALLEPAYAPDAGQWLLIALMGLGPLGAAFFLWDAALKHGDARSIGVLSFLTPLLSTLVLLVVRGQWPGWHVFAAAALIIGAALLGTRASR